MLDDVWRFHISRFFWFLALQLNLEGITLLKKSEKQIFTAFSLRTCGECGKVIRNVAKELTGTTFEVRAACYPAFG